MDARVIGLLHLVLIGPYLASSSAWAASSRTENFMVTAPTAELAAEIATAAERYRHELAIEWLGQPLPRWSQPCPVVAKVNSKLGAGGRTSFMFNDRTPFGWDMEVQGSRERILDSVLPHEVTHTIFATHFGRPLPRWADEGACTTVEHVSERLKQEAWLVRFLKTERGIPFNQMFAMTEYPADIHPLYSQGYSLARYLIAHGGKPKFVSFIGEGLDTNHWPAAVRRHYAYESLGQLQMAWVDWVVQGSREELAGQAIQLVAAADRVAPGGGRGLNDTELAVATMEAEVPPGRRPLIDQDLFQRESSAESVAGPRTMAVAAVGMTENRSWYARRQPTAPQGDAPPVTDAARGSLEPAEPPAQRTPPARPATPRRSIWR